MARSKRGHPESVLTDDHVRLIIEALFDIRTELRAIVALLEEDDESEGSDEEDS